MEAPENSSKTVINIQHRCKSFGDLVVLNDFNLQLQQGESVAVLGKSGSGKSVLIKCIIGLIKPDSGSIEVLGEDLLAADHHELDKIRTKIGFLFQSNALYDSMTVRQNLEFPLRRHWFKLTQTEVDAMIFEALHNVGLEKTIDKMPAELSGGMRKRIALARTLILKPEIILYDEPTTGLDAITSLEIINLMKSIGDRYKTSSIIITHDMKCVEFAAQRVAMLIDGKCYAEGNYETLKVSTDEKIRPFFQ
jgi:phospholipid/cholesterol/gamma-HCH transport system ATP-binding protein